MKVDMPLNKETKTKLNQVKIFMCVSKQKRIDRMMNDLFIFMANNNYKKTYSKNKIVDWKKKS